MFQRKNPAQRAACLFLAAFSMIASDFTAFAQRGEAIAVSELRCEYLESPLAIDTREPRLSWQVDSKTRGARQTAYQIIVASTAGPWSSGSAPSSIGPSR